MHFNGTVVIQREKGTKSDYWFVANCVENNIASQGKTIDEALENLKEAIGLYYENEYTVPEPSQVYVTTLDMAI
jgi:predicted RNase H-like HicB family nuclease